MDKEWTILPGEMFRFLKKKVVHNATPGPDGFKATLWKRIPNSMVEKVSSCLNNCLKEGIFPKEWKRANLVLIPKDSKGAVSGPPKVRPICLLDKIGKTFERIIADRLLEWLDGNPEVNLSEKQFGFKKKMSTCDVLMKVKAITSGIVNEGGVAIAVSIDIQNVFNSIP